MGLWTCLGMTNAELVNDDPTMMKVVGLGFRTLSLLLLLLLPPPPTITVTTHETIRSLQLALGSGENLKSLVLLSVSRALLLG